MFAPPQLWGRTLEESGIRSKHRVTVVGVKRARFDFAAAMPQTLIEQGDELVISGKTGDLERFSALAH